MATFTIKIQEVTILDMIIIKIVETESPVAASMGMYKGSDHLPVHITIKTSSSDKEEKESIRKSQRAHPEICRKGAKRLKLWLPKSIGEVQKCNNKEEMERPYKKVCKDIIAPWNVVRRSKLSTYEKGGNGPLSVSPELSKGILEFPKSIMIPSRRKHTSGWKKNENLC